MNIQLQFTFKLIPLQSLLFVFYSSPLCRAYDASGESYYQQHHSVVASAGPAQWDHPGLPAALLWQGEHKVMLNTFCLGNAPLHQDGQSGEKCFSYEEKTKQQYQKFVMYVI